MNSRIRAAPIVLSLAYLAPLARSSGRSPDVAMPTDAGSRFRGRPQRLKAGEPLRLVFTRVHSEVS